MRIRTHTNPFNCTNRFEKLNLKNISHFKGKLDLEIGFGQSSFILNHALKNPESFIVGVEVRKKAVELMEEKIKNQNIENVCVFHGNGNICLSDMFEDKSLDNIFIFHPDPWMKNRHNNRRLINEDFLNLAGKKLKKEGKIFVATDVEELWQEIKKVFSKNKNFTEIKMDEFWTEYYSGRWDEISKQKGKAIFYATFKAVN
ncbi:MAG: tRNA (guanosine(46)-N7)-methyltransferase TrmB [bacterium]